MSRELAELLFVTVIFSLPVATLTGIVFGIVVTASRKLTRKSSSADAISAPTADSMA